MLIQHKEYEDGEGRFYVEENGKRLAIMTYAIKEPDTMTILHTEVDDLLRGKNVGYQLVSHGAAYAREKGYTIIPVCPFAKAIMEKKKEEFEDVLKK
jgi:uncharacterized protein